MKLVAAMIVRNELGRYLRPCVESLLTFCDEVRVYDDGSDDGSREWLQAQERVAVTATAGTHFFEHEGRARNAALRWAMKGAPTHLLAVDADEFVSDGQAVRAACDEDAGRGVWALGMQEVWKADAGNLWLRIDGGWRAQEAGIPILWRAPPARVAQTGAWQIPDRALACGREPLAVRRLGRPIRVPADVLHFGWANENDRARRYARYVEHDGGRFHRSQHLDSIMWPDRRVRLKRRHWPPGLDREAIIPKAAA